LRSHFKSSKLSAFSLADVHEQASARSIVWRASRRIVTRTSGAIGHRIVTLANRHRLPAAPIRQRRRPGAIVSD